MGSCLVENGEVTVSRYIEALLCFEFEVEEEADRVFLGGPRWFRRRSLSLQKWCEESGCVQAMRRRLDVLVCACSLSEQ